MSRRRAALLTALCAGAFAAGCASLPAMAPRPRSLHLSELAESGDATRRASTRLVLQGLASDRDGVPRRAAGLYERAVQVDPTNPFAYLALARHRAEGEQWREVLEALAQTEALLHAQGSFDSRVAVHVDGLRGSALLSLEGRREEALALLGRARAEAPEVWGDGVLHAAELW